jgi:hypothetical protein
MSSGLLKILVLDLYLRIPVCLRGFLIRSCATFHDTGAKGDKSLGRVWAIAGIGLTQFFGIR